MKVKSGNVKKIRSDSKNKKHFYNTVLKTGRWRGIKATI